MLPAGFEPAPSAFFLSSRIFAHFFRKVAGFLPAASKGRNLTRKQEIVILQSLDRARRREPDYRILFLLEIQTLFFLKKRICDGSGRIRTAGLRLTRKEVICFFLSCAAKSSAFRGCKGDVICGCFLQPRSQRPVDLCR